MRSIIREIEFKKKRNEIHRKEIKTASKSTRLSIRTMPGIELVAASALIAEIEDVRRFPNANKLARFAGIAPVYFGSGGKVRHTKANKETGATLYFII